MKTTHILEVRCDGCGSTEQVRGESRSGSVSTTSAARVLVKLGWVVHAGSRRYVGELPAYQVARRSEIYCPSCVAASTSTTTDLDGLRTIIREELVALLASKPA